MRHLIFTLLISLLHTPLQAAQDAHQAPAQEANQTQQQPAQRNVVAELRQLILFIQGRMSAIQSISEDWKKSVNIAEQVINAILNQHEKNKKAGGGLTALSQELAGMSKLIDTLNRETQSLETRFNAFDWHGNDAQAPQIQAIKSNMEKSIADIKASLEKMRTTLSAFESNKQKLMDAEQTIAK